MYGILARWYFHLVLGKINLFPDLTIVISLKLFTQENLPKSYVVENYK